MCTWLPYRTIPFELPAPAIVERREQLLAAAWVVTLRSARTRRAYMTDYLASLAWLTERGADLLAASRAHVELWIFQQRRGGIADSTIGRRLTDREQAVTVSRTT